MSGWMRFARGLHRRLARRFPQEFQVRHGDDLERMGDDALEYFRERYGVFGVARMLFAAAVQLLIEYFDELRADLRQGLRRLRLSPGFTAIGMVSIALAVAMCGMFYAQLQSFGRDAPGVRDPDSLVALFNPVSYPHYERYRAHEELFDSTAAYVYQTPFMVSVDGDETERIFGHLATPEYFSTVGVQPALGRLMDPSIEKPGSEATVVVSHRFWQRRLAADPDVIGRRISVNGRPAVIVGVAQEGFLGVFPTSPAEIFVPATVGAAIAPELRRERLDDPTNRRFSALFRLAPGVSIEQAQAALEVTGKVLEQELPEEQRRRPNRTLELIEAGVVMPLNAESRRAIYFINGSLHWMVLLMACANLSVLLLAKSGERRKEVAVRLSVGASRLRVIRTILTESVVLALCGGVLGLGFLLALKEMSESFFPQSRVPVEMAMELSWGALGFPLLISAIAGLAFGLTPALAAVRGDLANAMKEGAQTNLRSYSRFGIRNQFMVFQLSGSLAMLLITGFVVWGFQRTTNVDHGFDTHDLQLAEIDPARDGMADSGQRLIVDAPERLSSVAGVRDVAISMDVPFSLPMVPANRPVFVENDGEEAVRRVARQRIGPGYLRTLGVPLVLGRDLTIRDYADGEETPIVINQAAADRLFPATDPIGALVRDGERRLVVIGVARNIKSGMMMVAPTPTVFEPLTASDLAASNRWGATVLVRGSGQKMDAVVRELESFAPGLTVFNRRSLEDELAQYDVMIRWASVVNGGLGVFGLILSVIGLFGVTAHSVARRHKEIGIRMALGARAGQVLRTALREGAGLVAVGGTLGFLAAYGMSKLFSAVTARLAEVFSFATSDPVMVVGMPLTWAAIALFACYWPARRSIRIDPVTALRAE